MKIRDVAIICILFLIFVILATVSYVVYTDAESDNQPTRIEAQPDSSKEVDVVNADGYTIVDTAQSVCYNDKTEISCPEVQGAFYGQDAQYQGNLPEYIDNGDGTITDTVTGLMWQQDPGEKQSYDMAIAGVEGFELAGYTDWRVPNIKELYSLIQFIGDDPNPQATSTANLQPFIDDSVFGFKYGDTATGDRIIDSQWVTDTVYESTVMNNQECFFGVNFADGRIKCYPTSTDKTYYAIYVRGDSYGENNFADQGNGTVRDEATGLLWQQADNGEGINWQQALAYCENLEYAGRSDWRLPNVKELQSIVDYKKSPDTTDSAALDEIFEISEITNEEDVLDYPFFWTGTTHSTNEQKQESAGAYVSFGRALGYMNGEWMDVHGAGAQRSDPKSGDPSDFLTGFGPQGDARRIYNYVRCVTD